MVVELISTPQFFDEFIVPHLDLTAFTNVMRVIPSLIRDRPLQILGDAFRRKIGEIIAAFNADMRPHPFPGRFVQVYNIATLNQHLSDGLTGLVEALSVRVLAELTASGVRFPVTLASTVSHMRTRDDFGNLYADMHTPAWNGLAVTHLLRSFPVYLNVLDDAVTFDMTGGHNAAFELTGGLLPHPDGPGNIAEVAWAE